MLSLMQAESVRDSLYKSDTLSWVVAGVDL